MLATAEIIEHALNQGNVMVTRHDANGDYRHVYGESEAVVGRTPQEMIGRPAYPWMHKEDQPIIARHHEGILVGQMEGTWVRYRKLLPDGSWRWLESQTRKGKDPETGKIDLVVVTRRCEDQLFSCIIDAKGNPLQF